MSGVQRSFRGGAEELGLKQRWNGPLRSPLLNSVRGQCGQSVPSKAGLNGSPDASSKAKSDGSAWVELLEFWKLTSSVTLLPWAWNPVIQTW